MTAGAVIESVSSMPIALLTVEGRANIVFRLGMLLIPISWVTFGIAAWVRRPEAFAAAWSAINIVAGILFQILASEDRKEAAQVLGSLVRPIIISSIMAVCVTMLVRVTGSSGHPRGLLIGVPSGILFRRPRFIASADRELPCRQTDFGLHYADPRSDDPGLIH